MSNNKLASFKKTNIYFELVRTFVAIAIALIIASIIIFVVSDEPLTAINALLFGPLKSMRYYGYIVEMMMPLTFTGLAISIMFQAKQFNLGAAGSFYLGAIVASIVAIKFNLPSIIHPMLAIIIAGAVGGVICFIPGFLKAKWGASELVSSLMLTYIVNFFGIRLINTFYRDSSAGEFASLEFNPTAKLLRIIPKTRIHIGIFIVIGMVILSYYFLYKTRWGYEIRMTGSNMKFAEYSGINTFKVILYSQFIGGAIAGIGGATEILGMYNRFTWRDVPAYGWDGFILVALARKNPALVPIAAFFLSYLRVGADIMSRQTDVQNEVVSIIQGIMILLIVAERFLAHWRNKKIYENAKESEKEVL